MKLSMVVNCLETSPKTLKQGCQGVDGVVAEMECFRLPTNVAPPARAHLAHGQVDATTAEEVGRLCMLRPSPEGVKRSAQGLRESCQGLLRALSVAAGRLRRGQPLAVTPTSLGGRTPAPERVRTLPAWPPGALPGCSCANLCPKPQVT